MAKNRAKNREKTGSCPPNPNKQSTQVYKTPEFLNQAESGVSGSVEVAHGTRLLSINASVSDKGAHGGKVSQYLKNAYAPKRRANKKNRGEADAPYAYEEEDTPNVDFTADRETIEKYCAKLDLIPIALIVPKNSKGIKKDFSQISRGFYQPYLESPYPLEGSPTEAERERRFKSNQDFLDNELFRGYYQYPDSLPLIGKYVNMVSDDSVSYFDLNYLPASEISHKMFMINDHSILETTMEQIVRKTFAELKSEIKQKYALIRAPLREGAEALERIMHSKKISIVDDQALLTFLRLHKDTIDLLLDYFAFAALTQVRIIGNVAHFPGIRDIPWRGTVTPDSHATLGLARMINTQMMIEYLEKILDGQEFLSPDNKSFYMERTPVRKLGFGLLRVFYEKMPHAKDYFEEQFLQPTDRIRDWVEHKGEHDDYMYASAIVDLGLDKLPKRFHTIAVTEARDLYDVEAIKETIKLHEEDRKKPNLEPATVKHIDAQLEKFKKALLILETLVYNKWKDVPESIKYQRAKAKHKMEVFVEYYESHCPNCRNLGHTIKNCSNKKAQECHPLVS